MPKTGFVALVGRPNVGKSTLLNHLLGEKVSIVSDKPQTTRHRILGIHSSAGSQVIFVDLPGVHKPGHSLNRRMMKTVYDSLKDVDLLVQIVDASQSYGKGEQFVLGLVKSAQKPAILVLNKVDRINKGRVLPMIEFYSAEHGFEEIIPLSALTGDNVNVLMSKIVEKLPEGEFLYPPEYITDQQERLLVSEMIREKVLNHTREELPYSTAVQIEQWDESERPNGFVRILASIIVEKDNHKKMVIGRGGQMIKTIGSEARQEIERFLGIRKAFLGLNVKVLEHWRDREELLNTLLACQ